MGAAAQGPEASSAVFSDHKQGTGSEEKYLEHSLVRVWDAGATGGGLTYYTTMWPKPKQS